jgi:Right handed beta helix region/Ricin-type beta-trefoil lectin domain
MLLGLGMLAPPAWAGQTAIVDFATGSCLEIHQGTVIESTCAAQASQQFALTVQTDGYALIGDTSAQQCLIGSGGAVTLARCSATDTSQMFKPIPQAVGGYALLNRQSGLCLANEGGHPGLANCETRPALAYQMPGWAPTGPSTSMPGVALSEAHSPANGPVINGLNIKGDYTLYGSKFDGAFLINSTITGSLKIDGVRNVYVKGNHLNSIWFRGQQPTDAVTIDGNDIGGAASDCVQIHDGGVLPTHVVIENNDIHDCGDQYPASGLYHAIYDQVPDVVISRNHIWDTKSSISVRSSAVVDGNVIERVTNGGAIEYFSDHAAPPQSSLVLENNVIVTTLTNAPSVLGTNRGLILLGNGIGTNKPAVKFFVLQQNKVKVLNAVQDTTGKYSVVYLQVPPAALKLSGNTFTNLIPNGACVGPGAGLGPAPLVLNTQCFAK